MGVVVQKYGGSSVANIDALRRVAAQVVERRRGGDRLVVVVSAMGDTTDELIALARQAAVQPARRELNMLVTAGERISMALLSMAIQEAGVEAISFTGSQSGIITEDRDHNARIVEVRPHRLEAALEEGRVVIIAGYQGVSLRREVTTLGRGGSDTTAVALAAALGAEVCEIYSDVDGVYSADPRICAQAKHLAELDYQSMKTMAGAGAQVLNSQAVTFAERAGITLLARRTGEAGGRQTAIGPDVRSKTGALAVVAAKQALLLSGEGSALGGSPGALMSAVDAAGGRPMAMSWGEQRTVLVDRTEIPDDDGSEMHEVAETFGLSQRPCGVVSVVGDQLLGSPGFWSALEEAKAPYSVIAGQGLVSLLTQPEHCDALLKHLHARLI